MMGEVVRVTERVPNVSIGISSGRRLALMELVSGLSDIVSFAQNDHQLDAVAIDFIFVHDGKEQTEGYEAHGNCWRPS